MDSSRPAAPTTPAAQPVALDQTAPSPISGGAISQGRVWTAMQLCLIFRSARLCVQIHSFGRARPAGRRSQRLGIDGMGTEACTRTPGRPPRRHTFTSTKQKRAARSGTPSATVWQPIGGKTWEQISWRQRSRFQTQRDAVLPAMQKR